MVKCSKKMCVRYRNVAEQVFGKLKDLHHEVGDLHEKNKELRKEVKRLRNENARLASGNLLGLTDHASILDEASSEEEEREGGTDGIEEERDGEPEDINGGPPRSRHADNADESGEFDDVQVAPVRSRRSPITSGPGQGTAGHKRKASFESDDNDAAEEAPRVAAPARASLMGAGAMAFAPTQRASAVPLWKKSLKSVTSSEEPAPSSPASTEQRSGKARGAAFAGADDAPAAAATAAAAAGMASKERGRKRPRRAASFDQTEADAAGASAETLPAAAAAAGAEAAAAAAVVPKLRSEPVSDEQRVDRLLADLDAGLVNVDAAAALLSSTRGGNGGGGGGCDGGAGAHSDGENNDEAPPRVARDALLGGLELRFLRSGVLNWDGKRFKPSPTARELRQFLDGLDRAADLVAALCQFRCGFGGFGFAAELIESLDAELRFRVRGRLVAGSSCGPERFWRKSSVDYLAEEGKGNGSGSSSSGNGGGGDASGGEEEEKEEPEEGWVPADDHIAAEAARKRADAQTKEEAARLVWWPWGGALRRHVWVLARGLAALLRRTGRLRLGHRLLHGFLLACMPDVHLHFLLAWAEAWPALLRPTDDDQNGGDNGGDGGASGGGARDSGGGIAGMAKKATSTSATERLAPGLWSLTVLMLLRTDLVKRKRNPQKAEEGGYGYENIALERLRALCGWNEAWEDLPSPAAHLKSIIDAVVGCHSAAAGAAGSGIAVAALGYSRCVLCRGDGSGSSSGKGGEDRYSGGAAGIAGRARLEDLGVLLFEKADEDGIGGSGGGGGGKAGGGVRVALETLRAVELLLAHGGIAMMLVAEKVLRDGTLQRAAAATAWPNSGGDGGYCCEWRSALCLQLLGILGAWARSSSCGGGAEAGGSGSGPSPKVLAAQRAYCAAARRSLRAAMLGLDIPVADALPGEAAAVPLGEGGDGGDAEDGEVLANAGDATDGGGADGSGGGTDGSGGGSNGGGNGNELFRFSGLSRAARYHAAESFSRLLGGFPDECTRAVHEYMASLTPAERGNMPLALTRRMAAHRAAPVAHVLMLPRRRDDRLARLLNGAMREGIRLRLCEGLDAAADAATAAISEDDVSRMWDTTLASQYDPEIVPDAQVSMSPGERAVAAGHLRLWRAHSQRRLPPFNAEIHGDVALILEDDAVLEPWFVRQAEALLRSLMDPDGCPQFDVLLLAYSLPESVQDAAAEMTRENHLPRDVWRRFWPIQAEQGIQNGSVQGTWREPMYSKVDFAHKLVCYFLTRSGAAKLSNFGPVTAPADVFVSAAAASKELQLKVSLPPIARHPEREEGAPTDVKRSGTMSKALAAVAARAKVAAGKAKKAETAVAAETAAEDRAIDMEDENAAEGEEDGEVDSLAAALQGFGAVSHNLSQKTAGAYSSRKEEDRSG